MPVTEKERTALALAALGEVTDPADVGELLGLEQPEPGVIDLRFACALPAYVGWSWVVSTADLPDHQTTVLEVELLPGEGSLLAPPWVPWTERLAEWRRQHPDERHPGEDEDEPEDETDVDDDEARDDEDGDLDEDDLAVDDELDVLDETELDVEESPEADEADEADDAHDAGDASDDLGDEDDDDERDLRPADEDRGP